MYCKKSEFFQFFWDYQLNFVGDSGRCGIDRFSITRVVKIRFTAVASGSTHLYHPKKLENLALERHVFASSHGRFYFLTLTFLDAISNSAIKNIRLKLIHFHPKSLQRSPAVGDFYGTGIEIWAGRMDNFPAFIASKYLDL